MSISSKRLDELEASSGTGALSGEVAELVAEIRRLHKGYGTELAETEAVLAEALGYTHDDEYGWVVGDHTPVTLAMEARTKIRELSRD